MTIRVKETCPYGHECEKIKVDNEGQYIERCVLYQELEETDEKGNKEYKRKCAHIWANILTVSAVTETRFNGVQINSLKNTVHNDQRRFISMLEGKSTKALEQGNNDV